MNNCSSCDNKQCDDGNLKAKALEKRHKYQCEVCMAIDVDDSRLKFHIFSVDSITNNPLAICDNCLKDLEIIEKLCQQKIDNPHHNPFKDFLPTFALEMPVIKEKFKEIMA